VTLDRLLGVFTLGNARSALLGIGAGALVAALVLVLSCARGRRRLGWPVALGAVVLALAVDRRLGHPWQAEALTAAPPAAVAVAAATVAAGAWVAAGVPAMVRAAGLAAVGAALAVSFGGVFLAVPENGQVLLVAGALGGVVLVGSVAAAPVTVGVAAVGAVALAWTVAAGFARTPVSVVGALGCYGLLLAWPALRSRLGSTPGRVLAVAAHAFLVLAAARWIGAAADATWTRVAVLAAVLAALAAVFAVAPAIAATAATARRQRRAGPARPLS
jgi:hypothetical protein